MGIVVMQVLFVWVNDLIILYNKFLDEDVCKVVCQKNGVYELELCVWWMGEMIKMLLLLIECMMLFWYNYFVFSLQKVQFVQLMYWQNVLLCQNVVGNFGMMLYVIGKDLVMLIYLDGVVSCKGKLNENFVCEVMELFMFGEGYYIEQDIKEVVCIYMGWSIDCEYDFVYIWWLQIYDMGVKMVFGQSGDYDGDQMFDILLFCLEMVNFIVIKFWYEFVLLDVDVVQVQWVVDVFWVSGYDIKVVLCGLFLMLVFWAL